MHKPNIHIRPSRQLAAFISLVHGGALLSVLFLHSVWWLNVLLGIGFVLSFVQLFQHYVLLTLPNAVCSLWVDNSGQWHIKTRSGDSLPVKLLGNSVVTSFLVVLNFQKVQTDNKKKFFSARFRVVLCSDSVAPRSFRHLRNWLLTMHHQT